MLPAHLRSEFEHLKRCKLDQHFRYRHEAALDEYLDACDWRHEAHMRWSEAETAFFRLLSYPNTDGMLVLERYRQHLQMVTDAVHGYFQETLKCYSLMLLGKDSADPSTPHEHLIRIRALSEAEWDAAQNDERAIFDHNYASYCVEKNLLRLKYVQQQQLPAGLVLDRQKMRTVKKMIARMGGRFRYTAPNRHLCLFLPND